MSKNEATGRTIEEELHQLRQEVAELTKRLQNQPQAGADNVSQANTEHQQAEERNRDRESMLQGVYRATPVGITFSVDRVILSVNESMCAITGYSERELVGNSARVLYATQEEFELVGRELFQQNPRNGQ
jgi:PAS domain-containing protein